MGETDASLRLSTSRRGSRSRHVWRWRRRGRLSTVQWLVLFRVRPHHGGLCQLLVPRGRPYPAPAQVNPLEWELQQLTQRHSLPSARPSALPWLLGVCLPESSAPSHSHSRHHQCNPCRHQTPSGRHRRHPRPTSRRRRLRRRTTDRLPPNHMGLIGSYDERYPADGRWWEHEPSRFADPAPYGSHSSPTA